MRKRIRLSDRQQAVLVTYTDIAQEGTTFGSIRATENPVNCFTDMDKHAEGVFIKADYQKHLHEKYVNTEVARIQTGKPVDIKTHKRLISRGPVDAETAFKTMSYR